MVTKEGDEVGSIRWTPNVYSEMPTAAEKPRRIIWIVVGALAFVLLAMIVAFKPASDESIAPLQVDLTPRPGVTDVISRNRQRRKLRDPFTAVTSVPIAEAQAALPDIHDEDFVIGVELSGEARAYPINMMGKPETELFNDTLAGRAIAVSFCNTCQSPQVFSRQVEGQTLTLFLSGELYFDNMIMKDSETGSDWVQLTGEAIQGPLKGHQLEAIPAVWTDWKTWRERYPETTATKLPRVVENYQHHPLYSRFPPERSFFSTLQWGLARGNKSRSWPYAQLARQPVVNDLFAGQPLLIVFDQRSSTPTAFERRLDETELTFRQRAEDLIDEETGSVWDPIAGLALRGPLKGRRLSPVPGTISLDWAWRNFHPDTEVWSAEFVEKP